MGLTMKIIDKRPRWRFSDSIQFPDLSLLHGQYQWHGSASHYTGQDVAEISGVLAVYAERRRDNHGPYTRLMCITTN